MFEGLTRSGPIVLLAQLFYYYSVADACYFEQVAHHDFRHFLNFFRSAAGR